MEEGLERKYTLVRSSYDDLSNNPEAQKYNDLCNDFSEVALIASKDINETYMKAKIGVHKLKEELLQSGSRGESNISSPHSHHLSGAYSICNEAIHGRSKKCDKLRSPIVAKGKGRRRSTQMESVV
jgi:hypothetical protein